MIGNKPDMLSKLDKQKIEKFVHASWPKATSGKIEFLTKFNTEVGEFLAKALATAESSAYPKSAVKELGLTLEAFGSMALGNSSIANVARNGARV